MLCKELYVKNPTMRGYTVYSNAKISENESFPGFYDIEAEGVDETVNGKFILRMIPDRETEEKLRKQAIDKMMEGPWVY